MPVHTFRLYLDRTADNWFYCVQADKRRSGNEFDFNNLVPLTNPFYKSILNTDLGYENHTDVRSMYW